MSYTKISKPTSSVYTGLFVEGKQVYDQVDVSYDDSVVAYDTVIDNYTDVAKPIGISTIVRGMTAGLMIPLTYSKDYIVDTVYTKINKPT